MITPFISKVFKKMLSGIWLARPCLAFYTSFSSFLKVKLGLLNPIQLFSASFFKVKVLCVSVYHCFFCLSSETAAGGAG